MSKKIWLAIIGAMLLFAAPTAYAQEADPSEISDEIYEEAVEIALNEAVHTLYHEIGHMLVFALDLPIFGREEDAVDNLATVLLVEQDNDAADQVLSDTIYTFFASAQADTEPPAYYDSHSLDEQRGYQIVCMMYGVDPDFYGEIADMVDLPEDRRDTCQAESDVTFASWLGVIESYAPDGQTETGEIRIAYEPANEDYLPFKELLEALEVLENARDMLVSKIAVPIDVSISARQCDFANAWWDPQLQEIVLCYELIEYIAAVSAIDLAQE